MLRFLKYIFVVLLLACEKEEPIIRYTLQVISNPTEGGIVNLSKGSSNGSYLAGERIILTPEAFEHWVFAGWEGEVNLEDGVFVVLMDKDQVIQANFTKRMYPLTIHVDGEGIIQERIISNSSSREYPAETLLELNPLPAEGWVFVRWEGDATGSSNPHVIRIDGPKEVRAVFVRSSFDLTVEIIGKGQVNQGTWIVFPGVFLPGHVELQAVADEGWKFDRWEGEFESTSPLLRFVLVRDMNLQAHFIPWGPPINFVVDGVGTVEETLLAEPIPVGDSFERRVRIECIPDPDWAFVSWEDSFSATTAVAELTVNQPMSITAKLVPTNPSILASKLHQTVWEAFGPYVDMPFGFARVIAFDYWKVMELSKGDGTEAEGCFTHNKEFRDFPKGVVSVFVSENAIFYTIKEASGLEIHYEWGLSEDGELLHLVYSLGSYSSAGSLYYRKSPLKYEDFCGG
ncbi:MAG: InlB B-repeat-containing protein [Mongoliitalea sp.]